MSRQHVLRGRTAVVTGAARGLGAGLVSELAARGMRVALLGRECARLEDVARTLPVETRCYAVDVTDDEAMDHVARAVSDTLGPPSVVIANAGIAEGGPFATSPAATWRRVIEVNLVGSAVTARAFLPGLLASRGYFLQIASTAAFGSAPLMSAYCASKAGAESFAQSLRAELAHQRVAVGIAYVHWTDTDMIRDADEHTVLRELRAHMPPGARRTYPVSRVAGWVVRGVDHRSATVYAPPRLRWVQPLRPLLPMAVTAVSRRALPRLAERGQVEPTGLLGAGGQADRDATQPGPRET
ncbi:short-chain dehydrogenase [Streptomyces sp. CB00455]|uniref:SDR family oxidoreductase n=1 Tax=Streptomyces sp. CB00455 TaxID=1703927 RepID=UPI00093920D8|nr:SDR family oxidoreductase [Streptomyces sp. CB00455]OKK16102.1 short-chain dehydrogenase [Streptomyces sp. CB00455]